MFEAIYSERQQAVANQVRGLLNTRGPLTSRARMELQALLAEVDELQDGITQEHQRKELREFASFLRTGHCDERIVQRSSQRFDIRDLGESGKGVGTATGSGALVPTGFAAQVDEAAAYVGPMVDPAIVTFDDTPDGRNTARPSDNDTSISGSLIGEGQQSPMQDVPVLGQTILGAYKLSSGLTKVSTELLTDAGFNFDAYLARKFGLRIGRGLNPLLTTGGGSSSNEPMGLVTTVVAQGNTIASSLTGISPQRPSTPMPLDLSTLEQSVDPIYRNAPGAGFMCHPKTLAVMREAVDSVGNAVYKQLHLENVERDYCFGYPIYLNPSMDTIPQGESPALTKNVILFGDFKQYRVRRVRPTVYVLRERFAEYSQVAFLMLQRFDGNLCDGGAGSVKCLTVIY